MIRTNQSKSQLNTNSKENIQMVNQNVVLQLNFDKQPGQKSSQTNLQQGQNDKFDTNRMRIKSDSKKILQIQNLDNANQFQPTQESFSNRKGSNFLMNFFNGQRKCSTGSIIDQKNNDFYTKDQQIIQKTINTQGSTNKPLYALFNNLITGQARKMTADSLLGQTSINSNIYYNNEKQSISQRLNNLKKFYNAEGPPVDRTIVPKTSYQQYRYKGNQTAKNSRQPLNFSHDNLDHDPNEMRVKKTSEINSRYFLSPPSTAVPRTPKQFVSINKFKKVDKEYAKDEIDENQVQKLNRNLETKNSHRQQSKNQYIKNDIQEKINMYNQPQSANINMQELHQFTTHSTENRTQQSPNNLQQINFMATEQSPTYQVPTQQSPTQQTKQKRSIVFENQDQDIKQKFMSSTNGFELSSRKSGRQNTLKNTYQKGTENHYKIEIWNIQENSSRKFLLCSEYEAHRNYKSDANQAEKVFLLQLDIMLPNLKQIQKNICSALEQLKDISQTDKYLNEIDNMAAQTKNGYLQVVCLLLHSKVCYEYRDYVKSIHLAKKCKNLAQVYGYVYEKMKSYELISNSFNALQKHKISVVYQIKGMIDQINIIRSFQVKQFNPFYIIKYFHKLKFSPLLYMFKNQYQYTIYQLHGLNKRVLRLSWLLQNENQELRAYDQLGKCYYYLGDLEKAFYYHEKMMTGELEKDQAIKTLSNSKLLNRDYMSTIGSKKKKKNQNVTEQQFTEEDDLISSSDDEFEITVSVKTTIKDSNAFQMEKNTTDKENEDQTFQERNQHLYKNKNSASLTWDDKLIMARLKVLQMQRTKEMKNFSKNKSVTQSMGLEQVGKAECKMDLKNQEYLQKILQKRGKATNIQKKYRISHLTPNRSILSYHEAEFQFLKNKNYSAQQDFIPTVDIQNSKNVNQVLSKYKSFFTETIPVITHILINSTVFQNLNNSPQKPKQESNTIKQNNYYDTSDFKFKKLQDIEINVTSN